MAKDFLLGDLGEGLTEAEVVQWLVKVGDVIEVDQPVVEVETAKAVVEVPSPFPGRIVTLHAEVGESIEVGNPLITVEAVDEAETGAAAAASPEAVTAETRAASGPGSAPEEAEVADMVPEPADAAGDGESGSVLVGYGTGGAGRRRRRGGAVGRGGAGVSGRPGGQRPLAKPPVRKRAKDLGIDLTLVEGSGPGGAITRDDLEAAADAPTARAERPRGDGAAVQRIPMVGVRRAIAEKMSRSRREIPEATSWVDADATQLWQLREDLNASQPDVRVSPLAIILRACVAGLARFPQLNAHLDEEAGEIVIPSAVHLGVAVQTEHGLMVPVIRDAHALTTLQIAAELNRLASAARDRSIKPGEMTGGTFSVSNYGSFGVDGGSPVINHPEAAILGVGRILDRPWVHDGQIAVRKVVQLSIAFDHRICDGGEAAGFLRFLADCVERPAILLGSV
ncbi:MAG TPA: dihydrolipoamide acetyltransferase family protein [Egibacteraceae bacterium]|nr:dihydrolipoamide acetyltransferase family protein [Egibacteraceae bacterium]